MQDFIISGVGKINGGEFDTVRVGGIGTCTSSIKAKNLHIEGVFNCTGDVEADYIYCEGVADFKSNIRAKKISVTGVITEKFGTKIEAEEIICAGVIKTSGEISADRISAEGCIEASEIVGDYIKIDSHYHGKRIIKLFNKYKSDVKLIEATTIDISSVSAETVNGKDIKIGPYCSINNIDCSGILSIDRSAVVKNITGNYTMRD